MSSNGPDCPGHKTTPYQYTPGAKQTGPDTKRGGSIKFTDSHDRPNFGAKSGGAKRPESGGSGYAGGQGVGGIKSDLRTKYKR